MEKSIRDMCMDQVTYENGEPSRIPDKAIVKRDEKIAELYQIIAEHSLFIIYDLLQQEECHEIALSPEQKCRILWLTNRIVENYCGISHPNLKEEPK